MIHDGRAHDLDHGRDRAAPASRLARRTLLQAAGAAVGAAVGSFAAQHWQAATTPAVPTTQPSITEPAADPQAAFDELVRAAYEEVARKVGETWGADDARMPGRATAVDYDAAMTSRVIVDYEAGEMRIETLLAADEPAAAARARLDALADSSGPDGPDGTEMGDPVSRMVEERAGELGIPMAGPEPAPAMIEQLMASERRMLGPAVVLENQATGRRKMMMTRSFGASFQRDLAARYRAPILREARGRGLAPSLVLAIMQTESAFNPRAVSPAPAYGLMQLVPQSGGTDAYQFVNGRPRVLEPEMLFVPEANIKLGTAYLELVFGRYLRAIENPISRLYCTIAAYNTGAGNVARAFTGTTSVVAAAPLINGLEPEAVFAHLRTRLPFEETRTYLARVVERREAWRDWDVAG